MEANSKIIRQSYIWKIISNIASKKWITNTDIAKTLWVTQPWISSTLRGVKQASDDSFRKIWQAIWLSNKELDKIFYEADLEEMKYKHGEKFNTSRDLEEINDEDLLWVVFKRRWHNMSEHDKRVVMWVIESLKNG